MCAEASRVSLYISQAGFLYDCPRKGSKVSGLEILMNKEVTRKYSNYCEENARATMILFFRHYIFYDFRIGPRDLTAFIRADLNLYYSIACATG